MLCHRYRGEAGPADIRPAEPDTAGTDYHRPGTGSHRRQDSGAGAAALYGRLQRIYQPTEQLRRLQDETDVPGEYGKGGVKKGCQIQA